MADPFVPLKPGGATSGAPSNFRVKVLSAASAGPVFSPLQNQATSHACTGPSANGAAHAQPQVRLEREGDRIVSIEIECSCGQIIELRCQY